MHDQKNNKLKPCLFRYGLSSHVQDKRAVLSVNPAGVHHNMADHAIAVSGLRKWPY